MREMEAVAEALPSDLRTASLDEILGSEHGSDLQAWIDRWGVRVLCLDVGDPSIGERPDMIQSLLRGASADPSGELAAERHRLRDEAVTGLDAAGRDHFRLPGRVERTRPLFEQRNAYASDRGE